MIRLESYIPGLKYMQVAASAPANPFEGQFYINSGNDTLYIYYAGTWQALHVLTPAVATYLLLESGDRVLLESGDLVVLE